MSQMIETTLGNLGRYINGRAFKPDDWGKFGLPIIRIANLNSPSAPYDYYNGLLESGHRIDSGDIIVSWSATLDAYRWNRGAAALNQHSFKVLPNSDVVEIDYLFYILKVAMSGLSERVHGATMKHVTRPEFEKFRVSIHSELEQQKRISASLNAQLAQAEMANRAIQVQMKEAGALLTSIYRDAFSQVVPIAVPPTFENPPPGWCWHKIADVARLESGHTPSRSRSDWWGGDVSWLSLTEIRALDGQWVESTQIKTNAAGIANSSARLLPRGTVCFSRTASVGFVALMAKPMATSQDFANWVCGEELDPEFLMHALIRARRELRELATGATHKTIYMPTLEAFHICAPKPDVQREIVRTLKQRLTDANALRAALDMQQAELAALPQRLLAQAFKN